MKPAPLVFAAVSLACLAAACADTYCQSGPRYGTACYSGATVQQHDPLAPVTPGVPPPGHKGVASWLDREPPRDAAPPVMFGHAKRPADAGEPDGDASAD